MSRDVDLQDPDSWTEEDLKYLHDRAMLSDDEYEKYVTEGGRRESLAQSGQRPLSEVAHTGDVNTLNLSPEKHAKLVKFMAELTGQDEDSDPPTIVVAEVDRGSGDDDESSQSQEYDPDDYSTWTVGQLKTEIERRNEEDDKSIAVSGTKKTLVARLDDDDRQS